MQHREYKQKEMELYEERKVYPKKPILMQLNVFGEIEKRWGSDIKMMKKTILVVTWTRVGLGCHSLWHLL